MRPTWQTGKILVILPALVCLLGILFVPATYAAGAGEATHAITNNKGKHAISLSENTYSYTDKPNRPPEQNNKNGETTDNANLPNDYPKTGDFIYPTFWITLISTSGVLIVSILLLELRSKRLDQQTGRRKR